MKSSRLVLCLSVVLCSASGLLQAQQLNANYDRDPSQPIDQAYTDKILKYTTDKSFVSPLVNYLPASKTVPTPEKVLGDVSGAPDMLPYAEDVYKYFRMLESASPRVKVFSIGHTEEGREMIAAAIADPALLAGAKENEVTRLRAALQSAQAAVKAEPPKKVVVDDVTPAKKPVKKKVAKPNPTTPAAAPATPPPATKPQ